MNISKSIQNKTPEMFLYIKYSKIINSNKKGINN